MNTVSLSAPSKEPVVRKTCFNCGSRRFGWKDDTSWDSCDEVCQIGDVGTLLFCIHGMTPKQVTAKLRRHTCEKWSEMK